MAKIKLVLKEKASELPKQKSSRPTCFFRYPPIVLTKVSQDNTRKQWKTIMVPRLQGKQNMS